MNNVHLFKSTDLQRLENTINRWLLDNALGETVQDIKITSAYNGKEVEYIALILS